MSARAARLAPWAGLIASPVVWWLHQQGVGGLGYFVCRAGPAAAILAGVAALALIGAAAAWSWRASRGRAAPQDDLARFIALLSLGAAGVFGLAVFYQALAGVLVPECAR